jgi:hypothetical protein
MAIPLHALGKATGIYAGDESSQKLWHLAIMPIGQAWKCDSSRSLQTGNRGILQPLPVSGKDKGVFFGGNRFQDKTTTMVEQKPKVIEPRCGSFEAI